MQQEQVILLVEYALETVFFISLYIPCKEVQQQTEATRAWQATRRCQAQGTIRHGYNLWVKPYQCSWHQS